jgi:hypothetical protein
LGHRPVEGGTLIRMRREPRPELAAVDAREGRVPARVERGDGLQPYPAEEVGEVVPTIARQQLRRGRVAKNTGGRLLKDAVAGERPQHPVQRVGVHTPLARKRLVAPRASSQRLRQTQVGGEPERTRHQRTPERVPEHSLGVHGRAPRIGHPSA